MTHSRLLLNDGTSYLLLNDGTSFLLLNQVGDAHVPASAGGKSKKQVGQKLVQGDLGPRPKVVSAGDSITKIVIKLVANSKGKSLIDFSGESVSRVIPTMGGYSISKIVVPAKHESKARLLYKQNNESWARPDSVTVGLHQIKKFEKVEKITKILTYMHMLESIDTIFDGDVSSPVMKFTFHEHTNDEKLIAFTHTSSWIGNVRYNTETKEMRVLMNGVAYNHCGVERIDYDRFEGANSKGEHWWREIKDRFNC